MNILEREENTAESSSDSHSAIAEQATTEISDFSRNPASDFPFIGQEKHKALQTHLHSAHLRIRKHTNGQRGRFFNFSFEL